MAELTVETNQAIPDGTSLNQFVINYALFMIMGAGANWVFSTALAQEIPYFENHNPEGLCIATYMNATTNFGLFAMAVYVYVHNYVKPIPYNYSVPCLLVLSSLGCFFSAIVYPVSAGGVSFMLYLCCALGGSVGALSSVIMNPFMTSFDNSYISAGRSGGSAFILLTAVVSSAQSPGASHPRFTVAAYFCIFGVILLLPIMAYKYITVKQIGLRTAAPASRGGGEEGGIVLSPLPHTHAHQPVKSGSEGSEKSAGEEMAEAPAERHVAALQPLFAPLRYLQHSLVTEDMHKDMPWLRETLPYMLTVGWVNFNTWGIMSAVIPFAMDAASTRGNGSLSLSIAYQVAAVLLVAGDMSTTVCKLPLLPCLLAFTLLCFVVYAAAMGAEGFAYPASAPLLIVAFSVERFLEAHMVTTSYRAVATQIAPQFRQAASRAVGMCDQGSTTTGALLSTLVVSLLFSCSGD
eukprot:gene27691-33443_t